MSSRCEEKFKIVCRAKSFGQQFPPQRKNNIFVSSENPLFGDDDTRKLCLIFGKSCNRMMARVRAVCEICWHWQRARMMRTMRREKTTFCLTHTHTHIHGYIDGLPSPANSLSSLLDPFRFSLSCSHTLVLRPSCVLTLQQSDSCECCVYFILIKHLFMRNHANENITASKISAVRAGRRHLSRRVVWLALSLWGDEKVKFSGCVVFSRSLSLTMLLAVDSIWMAVVGWIFQASITLNPIVSFGWVNSLNCELFFICENIFTEIGAEISGKLSQTTSDSTSLDILMKSRLTIIMCSSRIH